MTEKRSPNSERVPKYIFERAVNYLLEQRILSNRTLLDELNVERSSFVMAVLSSLSILDMKQIR